MSGEVRFGGRRRRNSIAGESLGGNQRSSVFSADGIDLIFRFAKFNELRPGPSFNLQDYHWDGSFRCFELFGSACPNPACLLGL